MEKYILIVAGGKGLRMGGGIPKQFLPIAGKPILMRTIDVFYTYDSTINIILILPIEQQAYWKSLCWEFAFSVPHRIANGGETRFHSVKNGLELVGEYGLVGVHDGVRPFVSDEVIERCFLEAEKKNAVIPVVDIVETVRHSLNNGQSETVNRDEYKLVQTPQVFSVPLLKKAYDRDYISTFTDDASVVEAMGIPVYLIEGDRENIKLTTPFDMKVANALI